MPMFGLIWRGRISVSECTVVRRVGFSLCSRGPSSMLLTTAGWRTAMICSVHLIFQSLEVMDFEPCETVGVNFAFVDLVWLSNVYL